jgi:hypothetical protein
MPYNITTTCPPLTGIFGSDCIGDSRAIINNNFTIVGETICALSATIDNNLQSLSAVTDYLISVTIPITGGNIIIPVGSTRFYKNLHSAYQSVSGLLFNETANVVFKLDPGEINEPFNLDLTHRSSNVFTISGTSLEWQSIQGSPITSVAGVSTTRLSATIAFDPNFSIPAVGDFININSLSGRHVAPFIHFDSLSGDQIFMKYSSDIPDKTLPNSALERPIQIGDKILITYFGSGTTINVRTVSGFTTRAVRRETGGPTTSTSSIITLQETSGHRFNEYIHQGITMQVGTPSSFRSGCNITQTLDSTTLTFSDGVATNTWLNPGDVIYTCGQARIVHSVSNGPTCTINIPFRVSTPGGFQQSLTNAPFLVKTHFERYRGVHKVVAVNSNLVTIEIMDYGFKTFNSIQTPTPPAPGNTNYFDKGHNQVPLPIHGIHSIGIPLPFTAYKAPFRDKIFKSKLNYTNCNFINNNACLYLLGDFKTIDSFCIVCEKIDPSVGIVIGNTGLQQKPASITIGSSNGGIGIYGFLSTAIASFDNTVTNGQNISFTQVYNQFNQEIGQQFFPFPNLQKLTSTTNTEIAFSYPFKNIFNIPGILGKAWSFYSTINASGAISFVNIRDVYGSYGSNIKGSNMTITGCYEFAIGNRLNNDNVSHTFVYLSENCNAYNGSQAFNLNYAECHVLRDSDGAGWYGLGALNVRNSIIIYRTCFIAGLNGTIDTCFIDMQNTVLLYPYRDTNMPYCHITGGGTLEYWQATPFIFPSQAYMPSGGGLNLLYPNNLTFKTVYESGDNPVNMWYFIPSIVNFNAGTNKFILENASYIYNCSYGAGLLGESLTQLTLDVEKATMFNCAAISTRGLSNAATVIGTGFNTTFGRFVNY